MRKVESCGDAFEMRVARLFNDLSMITIKGRILAVCNLSKERRRVTSVYFGSRFLTDI